MSLVVVVTSILLFLHVELSLQEDEKIFAFRTNDQHRLENWTTEGKATGFFGWIDGNGNGLDIEFIADENGYRVIKKKNEFGLRSRGARDRDDAEEFEFDVEDDGFNDAYSFRYDTGTSFREEAKRGGVVFGKYGFIAANGKLHVVRYTASRKRGYVPIREVKDASEYATVASEPISPVPLRRLRQLATPPDLWPVDVNNNVIITSQQQPQTFIDSTTTPPTITNSSNEISNPRTTPRVINFHVTQKIVHQTPRIPVKINQPAKVNRELRGQDGGKQQFSYNLGRQFHRQDQVGNDSVSGKYGWRDAAGVLRIVHYVADSTGFKIIKTNTSLKDGASARP